MSQHPARHPAAPPADGSPPYSGGPAGRGDRIVGAGECLEGIAADHGFYWETLWLHPDNQPLREARRDPWILRAGDRLTIPERRRRDESAPTGQRSRFRRRGVAAVLRLRVRQGGRAHADEPYRLEIDGELHEGRLDGDGALTVRVPAGARSGRLYVGEGPLCLPRDLHLSWLDPITELTGVQARLLNLGYECEISGELDEATDASLRAFQCHEEIAVTGLPDRPTRDALVRVYGC